jgi:hypothetical protein
MKRTGVNYKHDHRNHQDNPTLVRTQDQSPPDDDAVGDNELDEVLGDGSVHGECLWIRYSTVLTLMKRMFPNVSNQRPTDRRESLVICLERKQ